MQLKLSFMALLAFALFESTAVAAIVTDNQGIKIEAQHLDALLAAGPESAQLDLLKKPDQLQVKIVQLYLTKAAAAEQKAQPLSAVEQVALAKMLDEFYLKLKLKQLATEHLPDFEPLAKLDYLANQKHYKTPEKVAVEHILISTKTRTEAEALALINSLAARINKGEDFTVLAKEFSEDPSVAKNQGKLGLFAKGEMVKPFEDAAYSLQMGVLSAPVKTDFGYHLLRKYEQQASGYKSYAELKDELTAKIKNEYVQERVDSYFEQLKIEHKMQLDTLALDAYIKDKTKALEAALKKPEN